MKQLVPKHPPPPPPPPPPAIDRAKLAPFDSRFDRGALLGEGTHGSVFRATERATGASYAVKYFDVDKSQDRFIKREICNMQRLRGHDNILELLQIFKDGKDCIYFLMPLCTQDLGALLAPSGRGRAIFASLGAGQVKGYMQQLLRAVAHCHAHNVIHRDLKPPNILLTEDNVLKLADFGLSREQSKNYARYTKGMQTLWYRAPEMLYGFDDYDCRVDVWSLGCIFGEFIYGSPLFPGTAEASQLRAIYELCGTPRLDDWGAGERRAAVRRTFDRAIARPLKEQLLTARDKHERRSFVTREALNLLDALLGLHPKERISAAQALETPYFSTELPFPYEPKVMLPFREERFTSKKRSRAGGKGE